MRRTILLIALLIGGVLATSGVAVSDNGDGFGMQRSEEVSRFGECMNAQEQETGEEADPALCEEFKPRPATENPNHPVFGSGVGSEAGPSSSLSGEEAEDGFGMQRSEEVSRFGECMNAQEQETGEEADPALCEEFKPRPATENPNHPVFGENGGGPPSNRPFANS